MYPFEFTNYNEFHITHVLQKAPFSMTEDVSNISDLKKFLQFGMKLSSVIDFGPKNQYTFTSTFIGLKEYNYLIFELSVKAMEDLVTKKVNGCNIVLRGVTDTEEGHVIAFRSKIMGIKTVGSWLAFLEYPQKIESKPIRASKRYKVNVDAEVTIAGNVYAAQVVDLSVTGCGLVIKERLNLESGTEIQVEPNIKNLPKPYPKITIVNTRAQSNSTIIGVEFEKPLELSDELRLEILQLVVLDNK